MSPLLFERSVEYGLHALLSLAALPAELRPSIAALAAYQGVPPALLAKVFTRLRKAGLVAAREGTRGGYVLARPPAEISVLAAADAIAGRQRLFRCHEVRARCALFGGRPPAWATRGTCAIHAVMLEAERQARQVLAGRTLADLLEEFGGKAPAAFLEDTRHWFAERGRGRARGGAADQSPRRVQSPEDRAVTRSQLRAACVLLTLAAPPAWGADGSVLPLLAEDLPGLATGAKEALMLTVEYPPGGATPAHLHRAHVFVYVLEGAVVMQVKGGPEVTLGTGRTFYEGPQDVHTVSRNASASQPAKILVLTIKDKGAPVLLPAD